MLSLGFLQVRLRTCPFKNCIKGMLADISGSFLKPGGTVGETLCIKGKVVGFGTSYADSMIRSLNITRKRENPCIYED